jgi:hypothetical protein
MRLFNRSLAALTNFDGTADNPSAALKRALLLVDGTFLSLADCMDS